MLLIFYDLEKRQEKQMGDGSYLHEPNLCVFKQCCDTCLNTTVDICKKCGVRLQVLRCNEPISRFMEFILGQRKIFRLPEKLLRNTLAESIDRQPPPTILEYQAQMAANTQGSVYDQPCKIDDDDK
ncbi:hypothetical protein NQ315_017574 [Exocentrus adspersus]|uniref:Uncharacterized protein n=1 Tax=Exocentrus adspersus TaxID=1586481 RepID=A0AAV8VIR2_9CUCU|nr:hypothetical protein NQ315_017574 [Exocentrus adspersus]